MTSRINLDFLKLYWALPRDVQDRARTAYRQWEADASHPGLDFKRVHPTFPLWSARIDQNYRAVGLRVAGPEGGEITWFFVGTHAAYDRLLRRAQGPIRGQDAKGRRGDRPGRR